MNDEQIKKFKYIFNVHILREFRTKKQTNKQTVFKASKKFKIGKK